MPKETPLRRDVCLFCPRKDINGEHIFPKWLRKILPPDRKPTSTSIRAIYEGEGTTFRELSNRKRSHRRAINDVKNYVVCRRCNNNWLSRMEDRTKPILLALMRGEEVRLNRTQAKILGRWAVKTAFIHSGGVGVPLNEADLKLIKRNGPVPNRWAVVIGASEQPRALGISQNTHSKPLKGSDGKSLFGHSSCSVLFIERLVLLVITSTALEFGAEDTPKLRRVFPIPQSIAWPPEGYLSNREALDLAQTLIRFFGGPGIPDLEFFGNATRP